MVSLKHPKQLTRQTLQIYYRMLRLDSPTSFLHHLPPKEKKHTKQTTSHRLTENLQRKLLLQRRAAHVDGLGILFRGFAAPTLTPQPLLEQTICWHCQGNLGITVWLSLIGFREFQGSNPKKPRIEDCNLLSHIKIMRKYRATAIYILQTDRPKCFSFCLLRRFLKICDNLTRLSPRKPFWSLLKYSTESWAQHCTTIFTLFTYIQKSASFPAWKCHKNLSLLSTSRKPCIWNLLR